MPDACAAVGISNEVGKKWLRTVTIQRAIGEVQHELNGIDFLNEAWVKAQITRLFPMVMGDEEVPFITPAGEEATGRKFDASSAIKILEYVAPKKTAPAVSININNINKLSDEQLEQLAMKGMERVVSEQ